jgi:hypothetical protein
MGMTIQKHCLFAAITVFLCGITVICQTDANDKVVLRGTFVSVKARSHDCLESKTKTCEFALNLNLQFKNNTDAPIIIVRPPAAIYEDGDVADTKISFFNDISSQIASESTAITIKWKPIPYRRDPVSPFVQALLQRQFPRNGFVVIAPQGYYETSQTLYVSKGFKVKKEPDPKCRYKEGCYTYSAIPEYAALRIMYSISLRDRPEDPNAFERAKENWKDIGLLFLDSSGDYSIQSEVILLP